MGGWLQGRDEGKKGAEERSRARKRREGRRGRGGRGTGEVRCREQCRSQEGSQAGTGVGQETPAGPRE